MQTYHSREKVKARKVTEKDGETVIASSGALFVPKGDYIVHKENPGTDPVTGEPTATVVVSVWSAEAFNAAYSAAPGRGGGESQRTRKSAAKRPSRARKTAAKPAAKTTAAKTAADRVKARAGK
jgi:hypothetical protein